jgi:hypothetical protein
MRRSCHNPADGMPVYPSITSDSNFCAPQKKSLPDTSK